MRRATINITSVVLALFGCASLTSVTQASSYHILYKFGPPPDGALPSAGLVRDSLGRLYGTTSQGGSTGRGTIYRLTPPVGLPGPWIEEVLHSFTGLDGTNPGDSLLLGPSGELYGTTSGGGPALSDDRTPGGTVFRLDETPGGWVLTTLHTFQSASTADGAAPVAGVVFGPDGLLYGVTGLGGGKGLDGTAFSISPLGDAVEYAVIYRFGSSGDASGPLLPLLAVGSDLLGTTIFGPLGGTVFLLSKNGEGQWRESILHDFGGPGDFAAPSSNLIRGPMGTLYGCAYGGTFGLGGLYALSHSGTGSTPPAEQILYEFGSAPNDPVVQSYCGVILGPNDTIYGTTDYGGALGGGTFFSLVDGTSGQGSWTETVLHNFPSKRAAGSVPVGAPIRRGANYYGVTQFTSDLDTSTGGTVYEFHP